MDDFDQKEPFFDEGGKPMAAQPRPRKMPGKPKPRQLPPWRVILHNDDINEIDGVAETIYKLTPLNRQEARTRTLEAHKNGSALLLITHQERAELYVEQFASCRLTVTAEADR